MKKTQYNCFAIVPMVLFKNESWFLFLETKSHSKLTILQKKYIVLIINKYKLLIVQYFI